MRQVGNIYLSHNGRVKTRNPQGGSVRVKTRGLNERNRRGENSMAVKDPVDGCQPEG